MNGAPREGGTDLTIKVTVPWSEGAPVYDNG
jgi:hypothetical protein